MRELRACGVIGLVLQLDEAAQAKNAGNVQGLQFTPWLYAACEQEREHKPGKYEKGSVFHLNHLIGLACGEV